MGVTFTDRNLREVAFLDEFIFDSEVGETNTFTLSVPADKYKAVKDGFVLCWDDFEHGGMITSATTDSENNRVEFRGRTWYGILQDSYIRQAYDTILPEGSHYKDLVEAFFRNSGLDAIFEYGGTHNPSAYAIRWAHPTLQQLCFAAGKPVDSLMRFTFNSKTLRVAYDFYSPKTYTQEEFSTLTFPCTIGVGLKPYTHAVYHDVRNNTVWDAYLHPDGTVSNSIIGYEYTGADDRTIYEVSEKPFSAATPTPVGYISEVDAKQHAIDTLISANEGINYSDVHINDNESGFRVGDVIATRDEITGVEVVTTIGSKIWHETQDGHSVEFVTAKEG